MFYHYIEKPVELKYWKPNQIPKLHPDPKIAFQSIPNWSKIIGLDDFEKVVFGRSFLNSNFAGPKSFFRFSKNNLYSYFLPGEIPVDFMQKGNLRKYVLSSDLQRLNSIEESPLVKVATQTSDSNVPIASDVTPFASPNSIDSAKLHNTSQLRLGSILHSATDVEVKVEKRFESQVLEIDGGSSKSKRSSILNKVSSKKPKSN